MNSKWAGAVLVKSLKTNTITQQLAVQVRQAQIIYSIYNLLMIYLHDHNTGLARGQILARFYLTEDARGDKEAADQTRPDDKREGIKQDQPQESWTNAHENDNGDLSAVKGRVIGKRKGYGACWHCGERGRPRRECHQLAGNVINMH